MAMKAEELLRPLTYEDLRAYDDDLLNRYEILAGELVVSPAPALDHGQVVLAVYDAFKPIVQARKLGRIWVAPADVELSPNNIVQSDLFFIVRERLGIAQKRVLGSPDVAVEIVSPTSRTRDYITKRATYEAIGIREYWIVDPMRRSVEVLVLDAGRYIRRDDDDGIARSAVVPGVEIEIARLFDDVID